MVYKIIITKEANADLDHIIDYVFNTLNSAQAAKNILEDYKDTKQHLAVVADGLKTRTDISSDFQKIRTMRFKHHKYIIVYTIYDNKTIILSILHSSQDLKTRLNKLSTTLSNYITTNYPD